MAPDVLANALTYLSQFKLSTIFAIHIEDGVLKVIAANKDGIVIEYLWSDEGGWQ